MADSVGSAVGGNKENIILVGGDVGGTSLQESFAKFLKEKKQERKLLRSDGGASAPVTPRSDQYKIELRAKFIAAAKKVYIIKPTLTLLIHYLCICIYIIIVYWHPLPR